MTAAWRARDGRSRDARARAAQSDADDARCVRTLLQVSEPALERDDCDPGNPAVRSGTSSAEGPEPADPTREQPHVIASTKLSRADRDVLSAEDSSPAELSQRQRAKALPAFEHCC